MSIVVMGAVFVDIKGYPLSSYIPGGRNAGRVVQVHGGVSRNIVEDIANVALRPTFVSLVDATSAGADVEADKPITVYNPATTSVTLHKVSDRSGDTADLKPIAADFALYFCPFKSQGEFEGKSNYPKFGYVYLPHTGTTDAETGEITFDGLYSGWY